MGRRSPLDRRGRLERKSHPVPPLPRPRVLIHFEGIFKETRKGEHVGGTTIG